MAERKYRDPVHNIIALNSTRLDDRLLIALIDSPEFQRLRRIKQLGLALYTYQGAEHSRFTHSLGVMHVMTRVLDKLAQDHTLDLGVRLAARAAALLHDVGHGPFSHVIEKATRMGHENWTARILLDTDTELHKLLTSYDPSLPSLLVRIYNHQYNPAYASQLVSSQLDCDRLDYLLRDSLMTGAKYGNYDLEWIISNLKLDPVKECIYVSAKGLYAVEEYLRARFYMFRQVYFHHSLRAVENMLISILRRAVELLFQGKLEFFVTKSALAKLLGIQSMTTSEFLTLDDYDLLFHIKQWMGDPDRILSDLCQRFIHRRLFKSIDISKEMLEKETLLTQARDIVAQAGFDPHYYLLRDSAGDIPYFGPYTPNEAEPKARIYIESRWNGDLRDIYEVSEVVRSMHSFQIDRLCFPKEVSEQMYNLVGYP